MEEMLGDNPSIGRCAAKPIQLPSRRNGPWPSAN
jgi:hypothetical protein